MISSCSISGVLGTPPHHDLLGATWRQKTSVVQRRLDYWLISESLQDEIISAEIKASIKTDHSAITLSINGLDETERGPNFWKFNLNLVNDSDYCELLTTEYVNWPWLEES